LALGLLCIGAYRLLNGSMIRRLGRVEGICYASA